MLHPCGNGQLLMILRSTLKWRQEVPPKRRQYSPLPQDANGQKQDKHVTKQALHSTTSLVKSRPSDGNSCIATETARILSNLKVHYRIHNSPSMDPILSQTNSIDIYSMSRRNNVIYPPFHAHVSFIHDPRLNFARTFSHLHVPLQV
jgi:hypothetical protein